jgi:tRNA (Thr-GGU) A37 N-methylase
MNFGIQAVSFVEATRRHAEDDFWDRERACISLSEAFTPEALQGLADFSHVEVRFLFRHVEPLISRCGPTRLNFPV